MIKKNLTHQTDIRLSSDQNNKRPNYNAKVEICFPVDALDCQLLDQSIHRACKNCEGGLYDRWNGRRKYRKSMGGFVNDVKSSRDDLDQGKIRNAIDVQREVMREIRRTGGKTTKYM